MQCVKPLIASAHPTPLPATPGAPRDHPLLAEILARNLPQRTRSIRQAWAQTLLAPAADTSSLWLHSLFHATLEASAVPEMVIALREQVHGAMMRIFNDVTSSKDVTLIFLELMAFFDKERKRLPTAVYEAAKRCALTRFEGGLNEQVPVIALWYAEQDIENDLSAENLASLVEMNIRIGSAGYDSAWSSLLWLRDEYDVPPNPMWITHLSHWKTALQAQDKLDNQGPVQSFASFNTRMICYHALGDFEKGYQLGQSLFDGLNDHERRKTAHWVAASAWHMGDFESMADCLAFHPKGTSKSLYKAIIDVHHGQYASAFHHISKAQSLGYDELQSQIGGGPQVALKTLAKTEVLVELQEVITYKSQPDARENILSVWRSRFKKSHADANSWLKRLRVWTLACPPTEEKMQLCYLDVAKLCVEKGMSSAATRLIEEATPAIHPPGCKVAYTKLRFQWEEASDRQDPDLMQKTVNGLQEHIDEYIRSRDVNRAAIEAEGLGLRPLTSWGTMDLTQRRILARRYYRLAQWIKGLQGDNWLQDPECEAYRYHSLANKLDDTWYNASYSLAQTAMNIFEANGYHRTDTLAVNSYVVPAVRGLFQAIRSLETPEKLIKAILRLVTLWFRYGESESVLIEVEAQLTTTSINRWLMAIPQLIARLGTQHKDLQRVLLELLKNIASHYPHAVIWPLLTASQTRKVEHQEAARVIMDYICTMPDGTRLVNQAEMVGKELIRTSNSWMEKWRNIIDRCLPRQDIMEIAWHELPAMWEDEVDKLRVPETPDEDQFVQQFGGQIFQIDKQLLRYRSTRQVSLINAVYTDLYRLFGEIDVQLGQWRLPGFKLQLASAAPKLLSLRDCILTVPGQYDPNVKLDDQAFIDSFQPAVDILATKQMPRKLVIRSYTDDFTFLLKGNEDLRGDERIMQLFTLINTLLNHESEAFSRNLHLLPYRVIPLSPSAGLLSWVPNTQQLQTMITANREKDKTNNLTNKELASLLGYDPETFDRNNNRPRLDPPAEMERYDKLPSEVKLERLKAALSHSKQSDLKDVLWQRSPSAEIWIRRRTNFARTLGVGSFVGHIIGLGDRHLSNILVDQLTWGALHIDFGDLFGVAQERSFLPEKVPFRLTRMMTNSFELACFKGHAVPGSRGSYKQASIVTMKVLRESRSTLLAMLEAFLYDPLLSWTVSTSRSYNVAPVRAGVQGDSDVFNRIENSLIANYFDTDSYMAKVSSSGMTNSKALAVLAQIERKLAGYQGGSEVPLPVKKQVQELIEEATDLGNLSQGYVLGWMPQW
ncbi:hypothetical protein BCR39DRAFT_463113 [Naematelia encephala]|uniref:non-specific serine/threonine protein kinase n=1 Tax=Naematelia encephala TaxID=71784 RepID=A0A1Y2BGM0_9TREE|nr:hypothetical protein BCR39DRAFT_463113 [Naematelia encephala]